MCQRTSAWYALVTAPIVPRLCVSSIVTILSIALHVLTLVVVAYSDLYDHPGIQSMSERKSILQFICREERRGTAFLPHRLKSKGLHSLSLRRFFLAYHFDVIGSLIDRT